MLCLDYLVNMYQQQPARRRQTISGKRRVVTMLMAIALAAGTLLIPQVTAAQYTPLLKIQRSNQTLTVSWPMPAYHYVLEGKTNLSPLASWQPVATASKATAMAAFPGSVGNARIVTNFIGNEISAKFTTTNVAQFFRLRGPTSVPVFGFAVFYNSLLEFSYTSAWTNNGPVHANGEIHTGANLPFAFVETVTSTGPISSPPKSGQNSWPYLGNYYGNPPSLTNVPPLLPVTGTNNAHALIDLPPAGVPPTNVTEHARLASLAQVVLLISNTTVTVRLQTSPDANSVPGADPAPLILVSTNTTAALTTNFPFLATTNSFFDQRENKTVLATDIDVNKYRLWIATNVQVLSKVLNPTILYVADQRTNSATQLPAVRLRNGKTLPSNAGLGFTVATRNPLYVMGHYNCPNDAHLGTTNTTSAVPAALMADALTFLSTNWNDALGAGSYSGRDAADMTINAAILAGNVPSTGSSTTTFSGGAAKLFRLLEDWLNTPSGWRPLTLNTSFVCLFPSNQATNQMRLAGNFGLANNPYYDPPIRQYSFDPRFRNLNTLPPGTPQVSAGAP